MDLISQYFNDLSPIQREQFAKLGPCYHKLNKLINVVSRKDIANLYVHHVLHSLGIAKVINFEKETQVLDIGTGGGFPGIPLAIRFPKVHFHLVDSIGKKISVVSTVVRLLELNNVTIEQNRVEHLSNCYDFAISRATAPATTLYRWMEGKIKQKSSHAIRNGLLCLKGGHLNEELSKLRKPYQLYPLSDHFKESFFKAKQVVHVPI